MKEDIFHLGIKALIRNKDGKILLLRVNLTKLKNHSLGTYWDIPGGRILKDATVEETLKREVEEETGITSIKSFSKLDMVLSNTRIPQQDTSFGLILGIYVCEVSDVANITLSDEHTEAKWFNPKEAAKLLAVKSPTDFCDKINKL